jgi:hypothetical protein
VLAATKRIVNDSYREDVLTAIAPRLSENLVGEALAAARMIEDDGHRYQALAILAFQLTGDAKSVVLHEALTAVTGLDDEWWRAEGLAALAPQLTDGLLEKALTLAHALKFGGARAIALTALVPCLTGDPKKAALDEALPAALAWRDGREKQIETLAALAPHLTGEAETIALKEALATLPSIDYESDRALALAALAPYLRGADAETAQAIALEIKSSCPRALALAMLARHDARAASCASLRRALDAALAEVLKELESVNGGFSGLGTLERIVPHFNDRQVDQAFESARAMSSGRIRAYVLTAIVPNLGEARLGEVLAMGLGIPTATDRLVLLLKLSARFKERSLVPDIRRCLLACLDEELVLGKGERLAQRTLLREAVREPVMGRDTVWAVAKQIIDIGRRWRWL